MGIARSSSQLERVGELVRSLGITRTRCGPSVVDEPEEIIVTAIGQGGLGEGPQMLDLSEGEVSRLPLRRAAAARAEAQLSIISIRKLILVESVHARRQVRARIVHVFVEHRLVIPPEQGEFDRVRVVYQVKAP